ncbi:hypothetical protein [Comamonas terrigena]|uniref:hypothetical protein n=1 Tax=Comamonas terrigena TaxID=32013 RepID=UPI0028A22836|nr:hypothetical protein [Comamonas terrigena]
MFVALWRCCVAQVAEKVPRFRYLFIIDDIFLRNCTKIKEIDNLEERAKIFKNLNLYKFPLIQAIGVILAFAIPIWFSGWYPDAQEELHQKIIAELKLKNDSSIPKKPGFSEIVSSYWSDYKTPIPYVILAALLVLCAQIGNFKVSRNLLRLKNDLSEIEDKNEDLRNRFNDEQELHSETRKFYYDSLNKHLRVFCDNSAGFNLECCRASIYRIDKNSNCGRLIFRICGITRFESQGRVTIPLDEGIFGATYQNGDSAIINISNKNYLINTNKQLSPYGVSISQKAIDAIKMKSHSYYGRAIRDEEGREKIAILVFESLHQNSFDKKSLDDFFDDKTHDFRKIVQHLVNLDSVLNPYGGTV